MPQGFFWLGVDAGGFKDGKIIVMLRQIPHK